MAEKIVSALDENGFFIGESVADESPLESGVFLIPAGSVDFPPPVVPDGKRARFDGEKFVIESIPEPEPVTHTPDEIALAVTAVRASAYRDESDPLFFKAQRGEATMDEWVAKVAEIKTRFPDGVWPF